VTYTLQVLLFCFYGLVFRQASTYATSEAQKAREFVRQMPIYALTQLETNTIALIFGPKDNGSAMMSFSLKKRGDAALWFG